MSRKNRNKWVNTNIHLKDRQNLIPTSKAFYHFDRDRDITSHNLSITFSKVENNSFLNLCFLIPF